MAADYAPSRARRQSGARSVAAEAYRRLYKSARWLALRERRRNEEPTCRFCSARGLVVAVEIVDHVKPHRGDPALFFDFDNTQSLCKGCHDGAKQREEARGYVAGCDVNGRPIDPDHPWNRRPPGAAIQ